MILLFLLLATVPHLVVPYSTNAPSTILDDQFCQNYYKLGDYNDCRALRATVRVELRGNGTVPTLELGDPSRQPAMMFLHGWPDTSAVWANQMAAFCGDDNDFFCVAPSWIDFDPDIQLANDDELTWDHQIESFHAVVEDLGLQDITLVVFDFGCILGYQFAYRYPNLVKQIVAMDVPLYIGQPTIPYPGYIELLPEYQQNNIQAFLEDDDEAIMENMIDMDGQSRMPCFNCSIAPNATVGVGAKTGWPYYIFVKMEEPVWTDYYDVPTEEWEFVYVPSFPDRIPFLYLYSPRFPVGSFLDWVDERGDNVSEYVLLNDTDHWLLTQQPKQVNTIMRDWFQKVADADTTSSDLSPPSSNNESHNEMPSSSAIAQKETSLPLLFWPSLFLTALV